MSALLAGVLVATFSVAATPHEQAQVRVNTVITADVTVEGRPLRGAEYVLRAWPAPGVLGDLPDGAPVETLTLVTGVTGRDGSLAIEVDPSFIDGDFLGDDDLVNFELGIANDDEEAIWHFSSERSAPIEANGASQATDAAWRNPIKGPDEAAAQAEQGAGPTHLSLELGRRPAAVELGNEPAAWLDDEGHPLGSDTAARAAALSLTPRAIVRKSFSVDVNSTDDTTFADDVGIMNTCYWIATSTWDNGRQEQFVNKIGTIQAKPWIIQTTSSSHTMGVAYKSSSTASWSQSGTNTVTTGASDTTHRSMNGRVWNRVNYRQFGYSCNHGVSYSRWQYRPISMHSLSAGHITITRPNWTSNGCTTYSSGSRSKTQGSNVTFATGVSLSVLSVSARSAFTSNTKIRWDFTGRARMCGSTKDGWVSAPQAGAFVP